MPHIIRIIIVFIFFSVLNCSRIEAQNTAIEKGKKLIVDEQYELAVTYFDSLSTNANTNQNLALFLEARSYYILTLSLKGELSNALAIGEDLLQQYGHEFEANGKLGAHFYRSMGYVYERSQKNVAKGIEYSTHAYNLAVAHDMDIDFLAVLQYHIGSGYYGNLQYDKAIGYYELGIKYNSIDVNKNYKAVSKGYRGLGNCYWGLNELERAAEAFEKSLAFLELGKEDNVELKAKISHSQGYLYYDLMKYRQALISFQASEKGYQAIFPKVHPYNVWIYGDIGRAFERLGEVDSALAYYQKALIANVYGFEDTLIVVNPEHTNVNDEFQQFMIYKLKAMALGRKYMKTYSDMHYSAMLSTYEAADKILTDMRLGTTNSTDAINVNFHAWPLYIGAFKNILNTSETGNVSNHKERAHQYFEKAIYSQVHGHFIEREASNELPELQQLVDRREKIRRNITELKNTRIRMLSDEVDSVRFIEKKLFEATNAHNLILNEINKSHKNYFEVKFGLEVASLSELQSNLSLHDPNAGIISFFVANDSIHTSIISKDTIQLEYAFVGHDLVQDAHLLRSSILDFNDSLFTELSSALYQAILKRPIQVLRSANPELSKLVIIADRDFLMVPFETLTDDQGHYLIESFNIQYHYSSTLYNLTLQDNNHSYGNNFVGIAPNFGLSDSLDLERIRSLKDNEKLKSLPGAEEEVIQISKLLNGQAFIRSEASEGNFKKELGNASLLHMATHAIVNEDDPENSYIQLGIPEDKESEDGKLHFYEIYNLDLNAQLVTLSACNTGFGKIKEGEGVMSLSRAFAYAGVPATVVSLWPASDKSTPELMKYFYQNLKDGQRKSEALNNARKQYLATATGKARHPFYWGGFVVIGDDSPIETGSSPVAIILSVIFLMTMVPIVLIIKRKYLSLEE